MTLRRALLLTSALTVLSVTPVLAADPPPAVTPPDAAPRTGTPRTNLGAGVDNSAGPDMALPDVDVVSRRLDQARSQLQPNLGATSYGFSRGAIETLPQGDNIPLNQTLLQAPGVAQDSFGQIHVRGDHNEVQFRLDGVQRLQKAARLGGAAQPGRAVDEARLVRRGDRLGGEPARYPPHLKAGQLPKPRSRPSAGFKRRAPLGRSEVGANRDQDRLEHPASFPSTLDRSRGGRHPVWA